MQPQEEPHDPRLGDDPFDDRTHPVTAEIVIEPVPALVLIDNPGVPEGENVLVEKPFKQRLPSL